MLEFEFIQNMGKHKNFCNSSITKMCIEPWATVQLSIVFFGGAGKKKGKN